MATKRTHMWLLLAAGCLAVPRWSEAKFENTTTGIVEDQGGISDAEINADFEKIMTRFRDGRKSSAEDLRSRYSGILEGHNLYNAITHHDHPGNAMEGGMEEAAVGHRGGEGEKRAKELERARGMAGRCKYDEQENWAYIEIEIEDPEVGGGKKKKVRVDCPNYSANLVDMGSAHGHDDGPEEHHRALDLTKKAYDMAQKAGEQYGTRTVQEATDWGNLPNGRGVQAIKSSDGYTREVQVTRDGQTDKVKVGANIDLMKSEAAWLEQQKKHQIDLEWQSIRAARLAGSKPNDTAALHEFTEILGQRGKSPDQIQAEVAQRIYERQKWGQAYMICKNNGELAEQNGDEWKCGGQTTSDIVSLSTYAADDEHQRQAAAIYEKIRKGEAKATTAPEKKQDVQIVAQITECMKRGSWCSGPRQVDSVATEAVLKSMQGITSMEQVVASHRLSEFQERLEKQRAQTLYQKVRGDPGNAFDDDREYIFSNLSIATEGPLDKFEKTMTSWDFGKHTDRKATNTKPYEKMMAEIKAAQQAVIDTRKSQQEAAAQARQNGMQFQSNYNGSMFDPSKQSVRQLFGRNLQRDGSTLVGDAPSGGPPTQPRPQPNTMRIPANYQAYPIPTQPRR